MAAAKGKVIIIDYGFFRHDYYHPDRHGGTLMCHYRHHAHADPFFYPGLQDITAHVDFTAVGLAAEASGFSVLIDNQAKFLLESGVLDWLSMITDQTQRALQNQKIIKLTFQLYWNKRK